MRMTWQIIPKPTGQTTPIKNEIPYLGNGVYYSVTDPEQFKDSRVLVLFKGVYSVKLALQLTKVTGRVVLVTEYESLSKVVPEIYSKLKRSDVKLLGQSRLMEIMGEGDVEKVKIFDLDEENSYELFIDDVILPEKVEIRECTGARISAKLLRRYTISTAPRQRPTREAAP